MQDVLLTLKAKPKNGYLKYNGKERAINNFQKN